VSADGPGLEAGSDERSQAGCVRRGIVGCGTAIVAALLVLGVSLSQISRRPEKFREIYAVLLDWLERDVETSAAGSVPAAQLRELKDAYAGFRRAWREGRIGREAAEELRGRLAGASAAGIPDSDEVRSLIAVLRRLTPPPGR
jgi:hypothetical protein